MVLPQHVSAEAHSCAISMSTCSLNSCNSRWKHTIICKAIGADSRAHKVIIRVCSEDGLKPCIG